MTSSQKVKIIRAIILDVDGVLTDGRLGYTGSETIKFFNVKDGHGIKMALELGYLVGFLTGRSDPATDRRAQELNVSFNYTGSADKNTTFDKLLGDHALSAEECLYIGDDVADIPVLIRSGIGVGVADAADEIRCYADWQTTLPGGCGAVRETIVRLIKARGQWDLVTEKFFGGV